MSISSETHSLVEQQARRWAVEQERIRAEGKKAARYWPVIVVSREFGTQGAQLGKLVANRQEFLFWDNELVDAVARESGAQKRLISTLDERVRGLLDDFIEGTILGSRYTNSEYLRHLLRVVFAVAEHGGSVIIGRGAQFVLDESITFRVRAVAPTRERIAAITSRENISEREATARISRTDRERSAFIRKHFGENLESPTFYDLTINMGSFSLEEAADLVIEAYKTKFKTLPMRPPTIFSNRR